MGLGYDLANQVSMDFSLVSKLKTGMEIAGAVGQIAKLPFDWFVADPIKNKLADKYPEHFERKWQNSPESMGASEFYHKINDAYQLNPTSREYKKLTKELQKSTYAAGAAYEGLISSKSDDPKTRSHGESIMKKLGVPVTDWSTFKYIHPDDKSKMSDYLTTLMEDRPDSSGKWTKTKEIDEAHRALYENPRWFKSEKDYNSFLLGIHNKSGQDRLINRGYLKEPKNRYYFEMDKKPNPSEAKRTEEIASKFVTPISSNTNKGK